MKPLIRTGCAVVCLVAMASFQQPPERRPQGRQPARQPPRQQAPAQGKAAAQNALFAFRWGKLGSVPVREIRTVGGREAVLRYRIGWSAGKDGIRLRRTHVSVEKLNGIPAADPRVAPFATQLQAEEMVASPMQMDVQGRFETFGRPDRKAAAKQLKRSGQVQVARQLAEEAKKPATVAAVRRRDLDAWNMWFGAFRGARLRPGQTQKGKRQVYAGVLDQELLGSVELAPGKRVRFAGKDCIQLTLRSSVSGPELTELLLEDLTRAAAERGVDLNDIQVADVVRETEIKGLFELKTWRPHRVQGVIRVTLVTGHDEELLLTEEQRTFQFDWSGLKGAVGPDRKQPADPGGQGPRGKQAPRGKKQPKPQDDQDNKAQKKPQRRGG
ncbi:MAG: hypothetical protein O7B99_09415 [Planctomycetota bacterium]|nr:hypothetical protein [Planctomycetota bacterium]